MQDYSMYIVLQLSWKYLTNIQYKANMYKHVGIHVFHLRPFWNDKLDESPHVHIMFLSSLSVYITDLLNQEENRSDEEERRILGRLYGKEKIGVVSKTERFSLLISLIHIFP